jgi:PAS domain S-box-containing protein
MNPRAVGGASGAAEDESLLELILAATLEGVVDHDLIHGEVDYSSRWRLIAGYDPEVELEATSTLWLELTHPDDRAEVEELWESHVENGWPFRHTWRMKHHHGGYRWVLCRSVLRMTEEGTPARAISLFSDVTDEVDVHRRHKALAEAIPDTVLRVSSAGEILDVRTGGNPNEERLLGAAKIGDCVDCLKGELPVRLREIVDAALSGQSLESLAWTCNWEERTFHFDLRASPSGEGEALCLLRDVTEFKRLEMQLLHSQKLESIGQLAAGVAHEINTPTQYVGDNTLFLRDGFTDILKVMGKAEELANSEPGTPQATELATALLALMTEADVGYLAEEIPRAIEQSLTGIERVSKIVSSMKEFSHPGVSSFSSVDLNRAIEGTITVATSEWKYVADVELDLDSSLPHVTCLAGEFNQVVLNLVVNAAHAIGDVVGDGSGAKGTIKVSTRQVGDLVELRIADTGGGIPEEARGKIFDPFFTTKEVGKGTGQGLSIAHGVIVQKHGGSIDFETELGKGTTFIIRLPIASVEATANAA